jgi:hypothetical protein
MAHGHYDLYVVACVIRSTLWNISLADTFIERITSGADLPIKVSEVSTASFLGVCHSREGPISSACMAFYEHQIQAFILDVQIRVIH